MAHYKGGADRQCSHPPSLMDTCNDDSVIQIKYQVSRDKIHKCTRYLVPGAKFPVPCTWYQVPFAKNEKSLVVPAIIHSFRPVLTLRAVKALVSVVYMNITYHMSY